EDDDDARSGRDGDQVEIVGEAQHREEDRHPHDDEAAEPDLAVGGTGCRRRLRNDGGAHRTPPAAGVGAPATVPSGGTSTGATPSTWLSSVCGSAPVRWNASATCRKRKHIRKLPHGIAR